MKLGHPRTGSLGQIRQIHASDLPRRENRGQQQNLQKKELQLAKKNSTWVTLADEQRRRQVNWQRQERPDIKAKHTFEDCRDKPKSQVEQQQSRRQQQKTQP